MDDFRDMVLEYFDRLSGLGHALIRGIALSLDLERLLSAELTAEPILLFGSFTIRHSFPNRQSCGASASIPITGC